MNDTPLPIEPRLPAERNGAVSAATGGGGGGGPKKFKPVRLLPNLMTTASLSCGLLAIYYMVGKNEDSVFACWLIVIAAVFDMLDGAVARMTRSESEFGVQFDSLSDAIVFGTTPAILIFLNLRDDQGLVSKFAQFSCMLFTICGVLRLARFNTAASGESGPKKRTFVGMPIPAAAVTVVTCYLALGPSESAWIVVAMPWVLFYLALMMVSTYEYHSLKSIDWDAPRSFETLRALIVVIALGFVFKKQIAANLAWIMFGAMALYALSGPVSHYVAKLRGAAKARPDSPQEGEADAGGQELQRDRSDATDPAPDPAPAPASARERK